MGRLKSFALLPHRVPTRITDPIVGVIARVGVTPNHLSLLGFAGNVGAGALAARGQFLAAGLVMLGFSAIDVLDGALARATGRATRFGAVLDSALDRLSEAAVLGGLVFYFASRGEREEIVLCFAALAGSWLVSYVRSQALAQGLDLRDGLFTRAERVIVLSGVLIIDQVRIGLWIVAVVATATGLQRLLVARTRLGAAPAPPAERERTDEEQS